MTNCKECGEIFISKKNYQKFCSKKCCARFHSINQDKENKIGTYQRTIICFYCKKEYNLDRRRKFCSLKCKTKESNERKIRERTNSPERRKILDKIAIKERIRHGRDLTKPIRRVSPKGSGHINKRGYKIIKKHGHPNAHKLGSIGEHIWVMSEYLGRPLRKGENVHHMNGIRNDNRIDNLELWHKGQPSGQRVKDKIAWCKEFLSLYEDFSM